MSKIIECAKCHRTFADWEHLEEDAQSTLNNCDHNEIEGEFEICDNCGEWMENHVFCPYHKMYCCPNWNCDEMEIVC